MRREHNYVHCCKIEAALLLSLRIPVTAKIGGRSLSPPNCSPRETEKRRVSAKFMFTASCKSMFCLQLQTLVSTEATKVAAAALEL